MHNMHENNDNLPDHNQNIENEVVTSSIEYNATSEESVEENTNMNFEEYKVHICKVNQ